MGTPLLCLLLTTACTKSEPPKNDVSLVQVLEKPLLPDAAVVDAAPPPDPLVHQPDLDPAESVLITVGGEERTVSSSTAEKFGYTIVDLTDDWVPNIFAERMGEDGQIIPNNYRGIFRGLAKDELDEDGGPLPADELNYLEVYGIPPTLSIVAKRMLADESKTCLKDVNYELIGKFEYIPLTKGQRRKQRKRLRRHAKAIKAFKKKHGELPIEKVEALDPLVAKMLIEAQARPRENEAFLEVEKRLYCDDHVRKRFRHRRGRKDDGFQKSIRRFQRKNKLYVWGHLEEDTLAALSEAPQTLNHKTFSRVLRERIVAATGIVEDGTALEGNEPVTYLGTNGERYPVRNLVDEYLEAAVEQLGIGTPDSLLAFVKRRGKDGFKVLRVGVKFPPLPEYYSAHMDLSIIVDRGTVWYDFPYTDDGRHRYQPRKRYPSLSLMLTYNGETFPLCRWRTTIGGWAKEQAKNGYIYLKYKMSDVGKRVIRKIVAAPTWRPPSSTPISSLVKRKWVNGQGQNVVNHGQLGPGYQSAFGLVAGYFVIPRKGGRADWDRGIRAHGSVNYMSILSKRGYSHGCHRLQNDQAVRLYGFLLAHRNHVPKGEIEVPFGRTYFSNDEAYEMYLPTQGFKYELDPPIAVEVLRGNVRGGRRNPITDLMEIPGEEYPVPIDFLEKKAEEEAKKKAEQEAKQKAENTVERKAGAGAKPKAEGSRAQPSATKDSPALPTDEGQAKRDKKTKGVEQTQTKQSVEGTEKAVRSPDKASPKPKPKASKSAPVKSAPKAKAEVPATLKASQESSAKTEANSSKKADAKAKDR